ncbi:hypothetical protein B0H21DRAFT_868936 [Amylocystis lapponica]|nr:hypothetical protein B0H21DRAFT_868936 [Amylocystis lapponica]
MVRSITVDHPLLKTECCLGEAPLYDPKTSVLHFVDIEDKKVFHLNTKTSELNIEQFDLACAAKDGFAVIEDNSTLRYLSKPFPPEHQPHTRFNDGACDSEGRFIAGCLYHPTEGVPGKLYSLDPQDGTCTVIDDGPFTDSNGLGWSADGKTLYFTDSLVNLIYAYDYDHGKASNRRVFVNTLGHGLSEKSFPDGLCIDSEGGIWSARWGGSKIIRYTPDGAIDLEVVFPTVLHVTACTFGGQNNDQLYVTTAHCGATGGDASRQAQFPDSGNLFVIDFSGQYTGGIWRHEFAG